MQLRAVLFFLAAVCVLRNCGSLAVLLSHAKCPEKESDLMLARRSIHQEKLPQLRHYTISHTVLLTGQRCTRVRYSEVPLHFPATYMQLLFFNFVKNEKIALETTQIVRKKRG